MSVFVYSSDELLKPISEDRPCGMDLRHDAVFRDIAEARRSEDNLNVGAWEPEGGRKTAQWDRVAELCLQALRERTKDLRIACYLTEAALWLDGFPGLTDCLRLTTELIRRFWDSGLHPDIDDGDLDYRASALVWLDERMPEVLAQVNLTARTGAENYTFARYQQAKRVGTESAIASVSAEKRETIQGLIRQGWITMDAFDSAMRATKRAAFEEICLPFEEAHRRLLELERLTDERFGAAAPTFSNAKETFDEMRKLLLPILKSKQEDSPNQTSQTGASSEVQSVPLAVPRRGSSFVDRRSGYGWIQRLGRS